MFMVVGAGYEPSAEPSVIQVAQKVKMRLTSLKVIVTMSPSAKFYWWHGEESDALSGSDDTTAKGVQEKSYTSLDEGQDYYFRYKVYDSTREQFYPSDESKCYKVTLAEVEDFIPTEVTMV